eukprot:4409105-Alexandrium_andersonii.AAC.1
MVGGSACGAVGGESNRAAPKGDQQKGEHRLKQRYATASNFEQLSAASRLLLQGNCRHPIPP